MNGEYKLIDESEDFIEYGTKLIEKGHLLNRKIVATWLDEDGKWHITNSKRTYTTRGEARHALVKIVDDLNKQSREAERE